MKTVIVIPTYNERENISILLEKIGLLGIKYLEVVVVDDNSPDGTWKIVEKKAEKDPHVHILRRMGERGRGLAGVEGFRYALDAGAEIVFEMDGDLSHDPSHIPDFLAAIKKFDVVLGSRFVESGASQRSSFLRAIISRTAGLYIKVVLGFSVKDPTSGFRCFRREVLEAIDLSTITARGPFIVTEVLFRCYRQGFRIGEIPIVFRQRFGGKSKLGCRELLKNFIKVFKLRLTSYCRRGTQSA